MKNRDAIAAKVDALKNQLLDEEIFTDLQKVREINQELSRREDFYNFYTERKKEKTRLDDATEILETETDDEMISFAKSEKSEAISKITELEEKIKITLLPRDPRDSKNIFLEVRPAAGGDEAGLFAAELFKMYITFSQNRGRKTEIIEQDFSDAGGIKLAVAKISGKNVFSILKFESGVHRVQRIPATESQGRVHTSTVTVAVMPEAEKFDVSIDEKDITLDTFAASSSGGQNANKNQTGVRIHHAPTGIIVTIGDSKSQLQNKEKAFDILRSKLFQLETEKRLEEEKSLRGSQIGSGDRSEKIRTYNFPQDRVTDHRIKQSRSNIPGILAGELQPLLDELIGAHQAELLAKLEE